MTVTITLTDPTADESRAVRAYLDALHGSTAKYSTIFAEKIEVRPASHFETASVSDEAPVTAADAGAPDFDSAGMPWDERIHASSRATVADGTWRKKRGVSPEEVAAVEAELKAEAPSVPEVPEAPVGESLTPAPTAEPNSTAVTAGASSAEQQVADIGSATDAPPPPPAATPNPFLAVMSRIGKSKLDKAKKDELLTAAGALDDKGNPSILVLNKRPELIDGFVALLDSEGV